MNAPDVYAVIAGGGTAGHVHPALALAAELVERGHASESLHFIGSARGLEAELVPEHGYALTALPGRGIQRRFTVQNAKSASALVAAGAKALTALRRLRPAVLVSVGGYASLPAAVAAATLRIPVVVMEQNAVPGAANRVAARWAKACAVSFKDTDLPRAIHTGNPCRPEILAVDRARDRADAIGRLGFEADRRVVAAFGGSLGARRINQAVVDATSFLSERSDLAIRHIVGDRDWELFGHHEVDGPLQYETVRYERSMEDIYAAADLVISRAGATSVAEIAVTGTPAVLVPLPSAPGDHQTHNARALTDHGGGRLVNDAELDGPRVVSLIVELLGDPERLDLMADAAQRQGRRDAASAIADLVEKHARRR